MYTERDCAICGVKMTLKSTNKRDMAKRTCGRTCGQKLAMSNMHDCECIICNKSFSHMIKQTQYCSKECQKLRFENECNVCGKTFRAKERSFKTCSHECRWKLNRSKLIELKCKECGSEFERPSFTVPDKNSVFCSNKCNNIYHVQKNYGTFNRYGENWYFIKKEVLSYYENTCQRCDCKFDESLHVHHCVPFQYFDNEEEANNFENLIPLCRDCHVEVHSENREWYKQSFGEERNSPNSIAI